MHQHFGQRKANSFAKKEAWARTTEDKNVVERLCSFKHLIFICILMFQVPNPVSWAVTSWHRDPDIKMAQTFLPVGVDGQALDTMAEAVADKLFFAGEVCFCLEES